MDLKAIPKQSAYVCKSQKLVASQRKSRTDTSEAIGGRVASGCSCTQLVHDLHIQVEIRLIHWRLNNKGVSQSKIDAKSFCNFGW